ncbi:MAG: hypothetical protein ABW048_07575 [Sphingobium sp.]
MMDDGDEPAGDERAGDEYVRSIRDRLRNPIENPVTRARIMVERQVPVSRRGPGWDRHWRELEAYIDMPGHWTGEGEGQELP